MANPRVAFGAINRILASVIVPRYPSLSARSAQLGKAGISISFDGEITDVLPTMTGVVNSPAPYIMASVSVSIAKNTPLMAAYFAQVQVNSLIGDVTVIPDTNAAGRFLVMNASIATQPSMSFAGDEGENVFVLKGAVPINSVLFTNRGLLTG